MIREKAKNDITYRQRLLDFIAQVSTECMPEELVDEYHLEPGFCVLQPMIPLEHPAFEAAMALDLFDITRSRQMHSRKHTPACFKYGSKRKCRFRFPRTLVPHTIFDDETGV